MQIFGAPVRIFIDKYNINFDSISAKRDIEKSSNLLDELECNSIGSLRLYRPSATAAFAPRDVLLPGYNEAVHSMLDLGFFPVERRTGGHLAVYDQNSVVIDLVAGHPYPRKHIKERFGTFSSVIVKTLNEFSVDARVGQIAGEYCPGDFSVNINGTVKIAGIAQRIGRQGYHLGVVISLDKSEATIAAIDRAYKLLNLDIDLSTLGSIIECDRKISTHKFLNALESNIIKLFRIEN
jgi:lipoate-protein ligase A